MKYYVDCRAAAGGDGSENKPFNKIQQAADIAVAGDEVIVEYKQTFPLMPERYAFSFGCTKYNDAGELEVFDRKYDSIIIEIISTERGSLGLLDLKTKFEIKKC